MYLISLLLFSLWIIRIVRNVLSYVSLWHIKEYRWDRMFIHITKTKQGRQLLFLPLRIPPISPKTLLLVGLALTSSGFIFLSISGHWIFKLLVIDLATFLLVSLWVLGLRIPTGLYHRIIIWFAVGKLHQHKPMRVIGVTGSFGKTSTKEYLATLLSASHRVLKTESSKNSLIAVAEVIVQKLRPDHEVFIVEMGAYKQGEITQMAQLVSPQVGIITAINPQHQDLFKTIETTKRAKYELVQNLSKEGIAIFNADNEGSLELAHRALREGRAVWVYCRNKNRLKGKYSQVIRAEQIKVGLTDIEFTVVIGEERVPIKAPVLGAHQVSNILAAIAGAMAIGMKLTEAARGVVNIRPFTKTMEPLRGVNGSFFVNDTFNNNPDACKAAIDYLSVTRGKKILVFQPMIELGEYTHAAHEQVGERAAQVCDMILLTNDNWFADFKRGVDRVNPNRKLVIISPQIGADLIRKTVGKGDTVVFKGKEAESVLRNLKF